MESWTMSYTGSRAGVKRAVRAHVVTPFDIRRMMPVPPAGPEATPERDEPLRLGQKSAAFVEAVKALVDAALDMLPAGKDGVKVQVVVSADALVNLTVEAADLQL